MPPRFDMADIISGERLQELADVTILTDPILRFHQNLRRRPVRLCRLPGGMRELTVDDPRRLDAVMGAEVIFVYTHLLEAFFREIFPRLRQPVILMSHNSDDAVDQRFASHLDDARVFAWFAQNAAIDHPALVPVPLGIANSQWDHGRADLLHAAAVRKGRRVGLVYMNFDVRTNPRQRQPVFDRLSRNPLVTVSGGLGYADYLSELAAHHFCVCPPGNGLDCHRIWECLYLGVVPLVSADARLRGFDDLPIVYVDRWDLLDERFLENAYGRLARRRVRLDKIRLSHWRSALARARYGLRLARDGGAAPAAGRRRA